MKHIIIIGGVSVNDRETPPHDQFPYNFINPGIARGKAIKDQGVPGSDIVIVMFTPSYQVRALEQKTEHPSVTLTHLPCNAYIGPPPNSKAKAALLLGCKAGLWNGPVNSLHFINVAKAAAMHHGFDFKPIDSAGGLTTVLSAHTGIKSLWYFGHSNADKFLLNYAIDGRPSATISWGESNAAGVPATNFAPDAVFVSCGCNQGDAGGLAQDLQRLWGIRSIGSQGKTQYEPIGQGRPFPQSVGGYRDFTGTGTSAVDTGHLQTLH